MAVKYRYRPHRGEIHLDQDLTWESAISLVSALDTLVDVYSYGAIDLIVSSRGGSTDALVHVLDAVRDRRDQGVWLRTRVISSAQSAAAILICAGDERIADRGAQLLFHSVHVSPGHCITATETSALLRTLQRTDRQLLDFLADRALRTPSPGDDAGAEPSDRPVLEHLCRASGRSKRRSRSVDALARRVGDMVDSAVRGEDRVALMRLYRRLLAVDQPISPRLALTLRLIDRIGPLPAETSIRTTAPGPTIPEWRRLFPPDGLVPLEALTRHILVLGEPGAGKTLSAVMPMICAIGAASPQDVGTALVIDPTGELDPVLQALAPDRLRRLRPETLVLNLMAGPHWSLDADLAAGRWLGAAHRVLYRVSTFVPSSPARVPGPRLDTAPRADGFDREGSRLAWHVLAFVLMTTAPDAPAPAIWLAGCPAGLRCMEALLERARGDAARRGPNVLALTGWLLESRLVAPPGSPVSSTGDYGTEPPPPGWLLGHVAAAARPVFASTPGEARDLIVALTEYWPSVADVDPHYVGVRATAAAICTDFAVPLIARTLYFGCEAGCRAVASRIPDFARAVSAHGGGPLLLFQPRPGPLDLVGAALKALLFEAVLEDPDRAGGAPGLPLVCYVAEDFSRFLTRSRTHGEAAFLQLARSFGAACLLVTQSLADLERAPVAGDGTAERSETTASLVWSNTATKLIFRTADPSTLDRLAALCPSLPGLLRLIDLRPPSTLAPGECFAAIFDSRFVRCQLDPSPVLDALRAILSTPDPGLPAPPAKPTDPSAGPSGEAEPDPAHPEPDPIEPTEP